MYQKIDTEKSTSRWVLIQPPMFVRERLEHLILDRTMAQTNTLTLEIVMLQSAEMNWRSYLNDIQEQCQKLVCTTPSLSISLQNEL